MFCNFKFHLKAKYFIYNVDKSSVTVILPYL